MTKKVRVIKTDEEFKILADPYRMKIFSVFQENSEPKTVKQVADALKEVPAKVHYHVKKLISIGILELDHVQVINGINAKYYRTTTDSLQFGVREDLQGAAKALQVDQLTKVLFYTIDSFKDDVLQRSKIIKELEDLDVENDGYVSNTKVYLTDDEYQELLGYVKKFLEDHSKEKEGARLYSSLFGIIVKDNN